MAYKRFARRRLRRRRVGRKRLGYKLHRLAKIVNRTKPTMKIATSNTVKYLCNNGLVGTSGNAVSMFNVSDGTTFQERQNPIVHADSIELGIRFTTSDVATAVRGVLYTGPDAQIPLSNFWINRGSSLAPYSPLQPSSLCDQRYRVLYDTGPMMIGTGGGLHPAITMLRKIPLKGLKIGFGNSTGSTIPDYHPLVWAAISEDSDAVTTTSQCALNTQVVFRC